MADSAAKAKRRLTDALLANRSVPAPESLPHAGAPPVPQHKRNTVDTLFRDNYQNSPYGTVPSSSFVVEQPRPATTVTPPPIKTAGRKSSFSSTTSPYSPISSSEEDMPPANIPAFAAQPAAEPPGSSIPGYYSPVVPESSTPGYTTVGGDVDYANMSSSNPYGTVPSPYGLVRSEGSTNPSTVPSSQPFGNGTVNYADPATIQSQGAPAKDYFSHLPQIIRELYDDVNEQLSVSPTVAEYCLKTLMAAREAYMKGDYASAEYYVELVDAKLRRSELSMEMSRSPKVFLLWLWELMMLVLSGALIVATYVTNFTLFGLPLAPEVMVLVRTVGWGGVGGVIGTFYNLPWFVQYREYDPAYNMSYFVRPLQGFLIGGVLYLLSQAGVLASNAVVPGLTTGTSEGVTVGPVFLYLLAALAGFKQEYVYEFLDNILKAIFRMPQVPNEIQAPAALPTPNQITNGTYR